jgi:hypothetical protein
MMECCPTRDTLVLATRYDDVALKAESEWDFSDEESSFRESVACTASHCVLLDSKALFLFRRFLLLALLHSKPKLKNALHLQQAKYGCPMD